MFLTNHTYRSLFYVTTPKFETDFLWGLTWLFLGLAIIYLLSVFIFKKSIATRSAKTSERKTELSPIISEFLFHEEDADKNEKSNYVDLKVKIRELLKDEFNRKVFTEILLDLRKDVSGDTQKRLFKLYKDLGLEQDAFNKLNSWRWEVISKGILELTQMQVEEAFGFITKFINHKKSTIRKQAEIAIVSLKSEGINYFLDTTRYKISEWQQLKILDVLRNREDFEPPRFKNWLTANNRHVVLFAIRLMKFYNQNDAGNSLIELLKHRNNQIRQEAVACIKEFYVVDALPVLKAVFQKSNVDIKIGILGTIAELGSKEDILFLKKVAQSSDNFSVKNKAVSAINGIVPEMIMPTEGLDNFTSFNEESLAEIEIRLPGEAKIPAGPNPDAPSSFILQNEFTDESDTTDEEVINGKDERFFDREENPEKTEAPAQQEEQSVSNSVDEKNCPENNIESDISLEGQTIDATRATEIWNTEVFDHETSIFEDSKIDKVLAPEVHDKKNQEITEVLQESEDSTPDTPIETVTTDAFLQLESICDPEEPKVETTTGSGNDDIENNVQDQENIVEAPTRAQSKEIELNFDFLPLVTDDIRPIHKTPLKDEPMAEFEKDATDINQLDVDFEEVIADFPKVDRAEKETIFDVSEINFLPLVVEDEKNSNGAKCSNTVISGGVGDSQMNFETKSEVSPKHPNDEFDPLIEEIKGLSFLPIVTDADYANTNKEGLVEQNSRAEQLEGYTISDFEIDFQRPVGESETKVDRVEFELIDAPILNENGPNADDAMSWLMVDNELREIELHFEIVECDMDQIAISELIPDPVYYDEHEAYMMGLLDDLEELGDSREIPLLEELMAEEGKAFIKNRITGLIEQFSRLERFSKKKNEDNYSKNDFPEFSVFADLFKGIDREAKLILLDEIVAVGDQKEIAFLDGLLEDADMKIRKKAQTVLKLLVAKISEDNTSQDTKIPQLETRLRLDPRSNHDLVTEDTSQITIENYGNLLTEMEIQPAIDSEMFSIDFELSEVLDKGYSKKILNLPVIATEIEPTHGSFFSLICFFPKKIKDLFNG